MIREYLKPETEHVMAEDLLGSKGLEEDACLALTTEARTTDGV